MIMILIKTINANIVENEDYFNRILLLKEYDNYCKREHIYIFFKNGYKELACLGCNIHNKFTHRII